MQTRKVIDYIVRWLKDYKNDNPSVKGFAVGVSGGIDSAVVSSLAARTGFPLLVLEMPIHQSIDEVTRSKKHVIWLKKQYTEANVQSLVVDLTHGFESMKSTLTNLQKNDQTELALANVRSRLRMVTLYYFAQLNGYIVVGTGNKVEDYGIGFFTKYGDGGVDISPIADLLKSEVGAIARELGIDKSIIEAKPTDGLFGDARTDEDQIGATYDDLEWAMKQIENGKTMDDSWTAQQKEVMGIYQTRNRINQHKMKEIPLCIIPNGLKQ